MLLGNGLLDCKHPKTMDDFIRSTTSKVPFFSTLSFSDSCVKKFSSSIFECHKGSLRLLHLFSSSRNTAKRSHIPNSDSSYAHLITRIRIPTDPPRSLVIPPELSLRFHSTSLNHRLNFTNSDHRLCFLY
ncbi:hypothetical protein K1719_031351 [Acacia pycnantha]|nr:hypothetical protein K1719_031351 [Acacia pycnantha]